MTVAMQLTYNGIIPPKEWYHNPALKDNNGWTTAMVIANFCRQVPDNHWNHNPNLQDNNGYTVAIILARKGIIPP